MPFADNQGVKIYYEVDGAGPDLILAHGFSSTAEDWRELGYVEQLSSDYRLILVDSRGHGRSDKLYDPAGYAIQKRIGDYLTVLDDLGVARAHFWGFSFAGGVAYSLAAYAPDRFITVITGAMSPYPDKRDIGDRTPLTHHPLLGLPAGPDRVMKALEKGPAAWLHFWESNITVPAGMRERLANNDFRALMAQWQVVYAWRPAVEPVLAKFQLPCLLYVGDADNFYVGMKVCAKEMPQAEFVALPGLNHLELWANSDLTVPVITQFLGRGGRP